jgi:putative transposase
MLARTFGCVRVVWNRTLATQNARWQTERKHASYAQTDAALTVMKKDPHLAFLSEVSSVPPQETLRHQHKAFTAFIAKRARLPRFKSRSRRQAAHYTRSAFSLRGGVLRLAKTEGPLRFVWPWPDVDLTALDPAMVIGSREQDGRWRKVRNARRDFLHRASTPSGPPGRHHRYRGSERDRNGAQPASRPRHLGLRVG